MVGRSLKDIMPVAYYPTLEECDLTNRQRISDILSSYKPDTIIHLAAKVGGIMDNINKPADYFDDNILMNTNLVKESFRHGVEQFIGILSTCVYPDIVNQYPMTEDMLHQGPPTSTNFSYGYAKRSLAVQIDAYNKQFSTKYQYLIPCNMYGEYDKWGDNSHFVAALLKKIAIAEREKQDHITLFGTGAPLRQFMHSNDLAKVIKRCIDEDITESFNVAPNINYSIRTIAELALTEISPKYVKYIDFDIVSPDGQYRKDVSNEKMMKLMPDFFFTKLHEGLSLTYDRIKNRSFDDQVSE